MATRAKATAGRDAVAAAPNLRVVEWELSADEPPDPPRKLRPQKQARTDSHATVLEAASSWQTAGYSVVPIKADGSKSPLGPWKRYQEEPAPAEQIGQWFDNGHRRQGLGVVTGYGQLEMLEFEAEDTYTEFCDRALASGLGPLLDRVASGYRERSPRGGVHLFYRCVAVAGNAKLASTSDGTPLVETRGAGGFVVVAPSHGKVHPSGQSYECLAGSPGQIIEITTEERASLFALARTLDERPPPKPRESAGDGADGDRPGDDYNRRGTQWTGLLEPFGWVRVIEQNGTTYWRRPGKTSGISATTNHAGSDLLWVFSTSTEFEAERSYDKFGAYAVLLHEGDLAAAAKALAAEGFGGEPASQRFSLIGPAELAAPVAPMEWLITGLWPAGSYGPWGGAKKSLKTYAASIAAIAVAAGRPAFGNPEWSVPAARPVIYYGGEGGQKMHARRLQRIALEVYGIADLSTVPLHLVTDIGPLDKPDFIDALRRNVQEVNETHAATHTLGTGLLVLDSLYNYHPAGVEAGNLYERGRLLAGLSALTAEQEVALWLVDHFNKTGSGIDLDRLAQAGMAQWADSWLLFEHGETPDVANGMFTLSTGVGSRQWGGDEWTLRIEIGPFDKETGTYLTSMKVEAEQGITRRAQASGSTSPADLREAIMEWLDDHPDQVSKTDALKEIGATVSAKTERLRDAWAELERQRLIRSRPDEYTDGADRRRTRQVWARATPDEAKLKTGRAGPGPRTGRGDR